MTGWVVDHLGPDVPMHFTAFHPQWKMQDRPPTPLGTLLRARRIAMANGVRYAYTGNVRDRESGSTFCHACGQLLIERDGYRLRTWNIDDGRACGRCGSPVAGVFESEAGRWGSQRQPVRLSDFAP
jgi:pyruvate formate lyase activating enzyme